ncbi:hypothetical protein [Streptomyces sp. NBC_00102]|uniref:hypothetical protein n=1 Tax=Streptomyces sp. NBC_00102 TaxID=2975652 RepID=UPI002259E756|nr:hypothetical protein [Streptomyces sp. NBC_00102]MCX5399376.1 hypothetical protein [Streptomyces sp. NBC_00102]
MSSTVGRFAAASGLVACLALSLAACGGGREYAVPKEVCGVGLSEKALDPFLVDGEKFRTVGGSLVDTGKGTWGRCQIEVDDWLVVDLTVEKNEKLYDPMDDLESFRFENREKIPALPFEGLGAVGDRNAMVSTGCSSPNAEFLSVQMNLSRQVEGDVTRRRKDLEAFAADFVPRVKKALGCTA